MIVYCICTIFSASAQPGTHTTLFYSIYFSMLHCVQHFTHIKFYIQKFFVQSSWHVYILALQVLALTALLYFFYLFYFFNENMFILFVEFILPQTTKPRAWANRQKRQTKQTEVLNNVALKFVYNSVRKNAYHKMIFA